MDMRVMNIFFALFTVNMYNINKTFIDESGNLCYIVIVTVVTHTKQSPLVVQSLREVNL